MATNTSMYLYCMLLTAIVFKPIGRAFLQDVSWNIISQSPTLWSGRYSCTVFMLYYFFQAPFLTTEFMEVRSFHTFCGKTL